MPAPEGNQNAAKPAGSTQDAQITLRVPRVLKGRAVRASRRRNMKLSPWLIEAIDEKADREERTA